ncbi:MAG: SAM-dependent methyltransferase [Deltaproteobacteria bacterium]|nr:SAM-dependent methyltransferase [Deltaproteobacteria bacterium]
MADDLRNFIIDRIRAAGPVTFARFMDWCLYHPVHGYYSSGAARIGKEGDFYTGPCVHPVFGSLVARQLCQMHEILGGEPFTILEVGAGRGFLGLDILAWIRRHDPECYRRLDYFIVELSPLFRREQRERLAQEVERGKVHWLSREDLIEQRFSLTGCILTNELVDAFPVHRLVGEEGALKEIYVDEQDGRFTERRGNLSDPLISAYFDALGIKLAVGQEAEIGLQAGQWLEEMGCILKRGFMMTIDYGCLAAELYDPGRRRGTLRCFYRHQLADSPYENVGRQDITAHVDFTSLIRKGNEIGLDFTGLVPQYRFLMAMGLLEEMAEISQDMSPVNSLQLRLSLKHLIDPELGMGEVFKVLIQHRGVDRPELRGLRALRAI